MLQLALITDTLDRNDYQNIVELSSDDSKSLLQKYDIFETENFHYQTGTLVTHKNILYKVMNVIYSENFDRIGYVLISLKNNFQTLRNKNRLDSNYCSKCGGTDIHIDHTSELTRKQQLKIVNSENVSWCYNCQRYWETFDGVEKNIGNASIYKLKA